MKPSELKDYRKSKKMTQETFAGWLGCSKHTVVSWEVGRSPIPDWAVARIRADRPVLNPTLSLEQFQAAQKKAESEGLSLEQWIAKLITNAVKLLILLWAVAHLTHSPMDWSAEALARIAATGAQWFGQGVAFCASGGYQLLAAVLR